MGLFSLFGCGQKNNLTQAETKLLNELNFKTELFAELKTLTKNELKEYDAALKNIETILEIWDKNSIEYKYTLIIKSSIFGAKGEYETAIKMLDDIVESGIDNELVLLEAYSYQLDFYSKMKNEKQACNIYKKIEDINPETEILKNYECE